LEFGEFGVIDKGEEIQFSEYTDEENIDKIFNKQ
jgi:hypothetical protein